MKREVGKIKWFGGFDKQKQRQNNFGFIEQKDKSDIYVHRKQIRFPEDRLKEGTAVTFTIGINARNDKDANEEARDVRLLEQELDVEIIAHCFHSQDAQLWQPVVGKYLSALPPNQALATAISKVKTLKGLKEAVLFVQALSNLQEAVLFVQATSSDLLLMPEARPLRKVLPTNTQLDLCLKILNSGVTADVAANIHQEIIEILPLDYLTKLPSILLDDDNFILQCFRSDRLSKYCQPLVTIKKIIYGSKLFEIAPPHIKLQIIQNEFGQVFDIIRKCILEPLFKTDWPAEEIYGKSISEDDRLLAQLWMPKEKKEDYSTAQMLSARCAEKVVLRFYQSLGYDVVDTSIRQLGGVEESWRLYDLLLDAQIAIDVKNARTPFHNKRRYVEHCVPKFKESRQGQDVIIAGVLSPYLTLERLDDPSKKSPFSILPIKFLGETNRTSIQELEKKFCQANIEIIVRGRKNVIPPWMFEYPDRFYIQRDKHRKQLKNTINNTGFLTWNDFLLLGKDLNPFPPLLSSGIPLPTSWNNALSEWQKDFYNKLLPPNEESKITLPFLFLTILTHFLEIVNNNVPVEHYNPGDYSKLLFSNNDKDRKLPLGIYDPLNIISDFCSTLAVLWKNKSTTNLHEFTFFRFNGLGLLEGRRNQSNKMETIIAYCGGFIEGTGRCGFSPLIIGQDKTCSRCGKLICRTCGYCNEYCPDCKQRMKVYSEEPPFEGNMTVEGNVTDFQQTEIDLSEDEIPF